MSYASLAHEVKSVAPPKTGTAANSLRVNRPGDSFEQEADRVAEQVMSGRAFKAAWSLSRINMAPPLQRECSCGGSCDECKKKKDEKKEEKNLQREATGEYTPEVAPASVHAVLTGPGKMLDNTTRRFMEARFGYDFGSVRIYDDGAAANSARSVAANAYTVGEKIVFNQGRYAPESQTGRRLLAHELSHVVQQTNPAPKNNAGGYLADRRSHAGLRSAGGLRIQRDPSKYASLSIAKLERLAVTDKEALEALRSRFEAMTTEQLLRFEKNPMAHSILAQRNVVPADAEGQGRFSDSSVMDSLKSDLQQQRAALRAATGVVRRAPSDVLPGGRTQGGTMGSARTDIPGLEGQKFVGRSPAAGGAVNPKSNFPPATDIKLNPQTHAHAEQDIADQLEAALSKIPREQLKGRRVWMLIEQEPCSTCAQGVGNASVEAGVLKKLSKAFPEVTFEIKNLDTSAIIILKQGVQEGGEAVAGSEQSKVANDAAADPAKSGEAPSASTVRVGTKVEVLSAVKQANGSTISEVEYTFAENLEQLSQAAGGANVPAKIVLRITQGADGAITAVEGLSGEPAAMVRALAEQTLSHLSSGEAGAAASVGRYAALSKGLKIGGWAAFVVITGYQLYKATPAQRPRVLAQAGGGLVGGAIASYAVCNAALDLETAGLGILFCGLIVGGVGAYAGSEAAGDIYDEATATDLDRALHEVDGREENERVLFNVLVGSLGNTADCIDAKFVWSFLSTVPSGLEDYEVVIAAGELAQAMGVGPRPVSSARAAVPGSKDRSHASHLPVPRPKNKGIPCPNCHSSHPPEPEKKFDFSKFDDLKNARPCSEILNSALSALRRALDRVPSVQRGRDAVNSLQPATPGTGMPQTRPDSNAFPSVQEQQGSVCPNCHAPNRSREDEKKFNLRSQPLTPRDRAAIVKWVNTPPATGNTHATPPGVHLPPAPSAGLPPVEEQKKNLCPNCHRSMAENKGPDLLHGPLGFGEPHSGPISDDDRKALSAWLNTQPQ